MAHPILRSHRLSAVFFIIPGFLDHPQLPWWDEIAWMVRASTRSRLWLRPWMADPVILDEPHRERAVRRLLKAYKLLPADRNEAYLQALAEATGSGRWCGEGADRLWVTWDMVREMRGAGMAIGGHTVTHPILARMPAAQQLREIADCGRRLREELGEPMRLFAYPVGGLHSFNTDTRACARQAGVRHAFSDYGGFRKFPEWDDYDIRRMAIDVSVAPELFRSIVTLPQIFSRMR